MVTTITIGFFTVAFLSVLSEPLALAEAIGCGGALILLLGLQVKLCVHALRRASLPHRTLFLAVQFLLVYGPFPVAREHWIGLPGFLAGSLLLALSGRKAWVLAGCVALAEPFLIYACVKDVHTALYGLVSTALTAVVLFSVVRLACLVGELHTMRTELAQLAVTKERLRFARDLHDLVGYRLSTASIQAELSHRLINRNPRAARSQLEQLVENIRGTHAEVRKVAHGYRYLSLDSELESARITLTSAGIKPRFSFHGVEVPQQAGSTLAAVLREAVTNVLRHSTARFCTVRLSHQKDTIRLIIINDRPHPHRPDHGPDDGAGLQNLSERLATHGGSLLVNRSGTGRGEEFRLEARLPFSRRPAPETDRVAEARTPQRRLVPWRAASDPSVPQGDPDGVDAVSGS